MVEQLGFLSSAPSQPRSSRWTSKHVEVVGVDLGDDERHVLVHPPVRGVRGDHVAGLAEVWFDFCAHAGGERREDEVDVVRHLVGRRRDDFHLGDVVRNRRVDAPLRRLAVAFARARFTRRDRCQFEVGMRVDQLDEALTDGPRRTENTDAYSHYLRHRCG